MSEFNIINKIGESIDAAIKDLHGNEFLKELHDTFSKVMTRMSEPMQLAIVGKISSSKSTLVNAILGQAEVVRTGEMEETWNVSWLKYGDPSNDIIVHYKDGRIPENISRSNWSQWANRDRDENEKLKNVISYIEVTYNHEILKTINIIDTPGLDSFYGKDSQNTLDFLKQVHPDAVIMLFSKSINTDTLAVIEEFRQGVGSGFSPINAMGIMSKIDNIWASDPDINPLWEARKVAARLMTLEPVKNTLFNIFPVSALVALSASTIEQRDVCLLKTLAKTDEDTWEDMLVSEARFVENRSDVEASVIERQYLRDKFGRYSISIMVDLIRSSPEVQIDEIRILLTDKSGFNDFMKVVLSHFGQRATLIKSYSSVFALSGACRTTYASLKENPNAKQALVKLEQVIERIDELIRVLTVEFNAVGILKDIYDGKLEVEEDELEELRRISGEFGQSCTIRLGMETVVVPFELVRESIERIKFWTTAYNIEGISSPTKARFYKLMINLYVQLLSDIKAAIYRYESSSNFLFGR